MKPVINQVTDRLTRDSAVLLLIDHQIGPLWEPDGARLRHDVACLAKAAASLSVPTIVSAMSCDAWGPIIPELRNAAPRAPIIRRNIVNAWNVERVRRAVEVTTRRDLIIAGVAIEACVAYAALAAADSGYRVHVVLDASGHLCPQAATIAIARMLEAGVMFTNIGTLSVEWVRDSSDSRAADVLALAVRHLLPSPPAVSSVPERPASDAA